MSQSRFICQVVCTGMQGMSAFVPGDSIIQSMFICQVLCTGIQGISAPVWGVHWLKKVHLQNLTTRCQQQCEIAILDH